jgi:hypothetical protein
LTESGDAGHIAARSGDICRQPGRLLSPSGHRRSIKIAVHHRGTIIDERLSLEQIEKNAWGPAPKDATGLMRTVHDLRTKPIGELEPGDIRVLLGQQEGVNVLAPRALAMLEHEPLLEASYYPGDLLVTVLRLPGSYWSAQPNQYAIAKSVIANVQLPDDGYPSEKTVKEAIDAFD